MAIKCDNAMDVSAAIFCARCTRASMGARARCGDQRPGTPIPIALDAFRPRCAALPRRRARRTRLDGGTGDRIRGSRSAIRLSSPGASSGADIRAWRHGSFHHTAKSSYHISAGAEKSRDFRGAGGDTSTRPRYGVNHNVLSPAHGDLECSCTTNACAAGSGLHDKVAFWRG